MMQRLKPDVDVIKDVLEAVLRVWPQDRFAGSLLQQYAERGGLSRKQLEGLYQKAQKAGVVSTAKAATLEAIIRKKVKRYRSELPAAAPLYQKDVATGNMIAAVLSVFPEHKRALYLQSNYDNNIPLSATEINELKKFVQLAAKKNKND
ncbi:MAG TPA: hypothetical protein PKC69_03965 [Chitinophagaceae bacterium]|nr:hypothetical protein [Chitinophagaceae bacterium]